MSFGKLTDGFRADFTAALALQGKKPTNEVYQECMKVLKDHKVSYTVDAKPAYFLVHKENRGRLMLSPHNAHRNCLSIHKVGADMSQLINAVAMELPAAGRARDEQFIANERLVKAADGLLPSINSEERYATLGCGHTAAICKLAGQANPKTPIAELKDEDGNLNVAKLKQNPQFKTMIEDGWSWIIIPALVDELFPAFAKIAQKALNTSNHVGIAVGELETQLQLSDLVDDNGFTENNKDWEALAVNFVEDLCVPCAPYAKHLLHFVKLYGGGPGAPHIRLMDNVAKTFQCTHVCLGPTFWQAISTALDDTLDPCKIFIHDWMHGIFVGGVWNVALYLFLEMLIDAGYIDIYNVFANFIAGWSWPGRICSAHLHEICQGDRRDKHRAAQHIKAQASDMLSIVGVTKMFILTVVLKLEVDCKLYCDAVLALVYLIDVIVAVPRVATHPSRILEAAEDFLQKFVSAWGHEWTIPKFHWLLHFHQQFMLNCFCLERKHRVPKRYAGDLTNTSRRPSRSLLMEITSHHLAQLSDKDTLNFKIGLVNGKACTNKLKKSILDMLDMDVEDVSCSIESRFNPLGTCKRHDLVLFKDGVHALKVAKIVLHYDVQGVPVSVVSMFNIIHADAEQGWSIWEAATGGHELIETDCIVDAVVYCQLSGTKIKVLVPLHHR